MVLRGFARDSQAAREWSFDALLERFGHEQVLLTTEALDGEPGTLGARHRGEEDWLRRAS